MEQSIKTKKFGTLDTSGRVHVYFAGKEGDAAPLNMGLSFDVGGKSYVFIPEDRITKGATSGDQGRAYVGFLNPDLLSSLKNNSEYVDIAGSQFGSFDAGKFISDQMGGSTKGYLTTTEVATPIINAGVSEFNPQLTGQLKGIGSYQGQPVYYGDKGYIEPSGRYNYQEKTGQKIVGYTYSNGGGLLAGLGREIVKAGPALPIALDIIGAAYGLPGIGTAVAGGVTAGAIASGDEKTAVNYAAQTIAGQLGIGSGVAGATGSTVAGQMAQATAGNILAGQNPEDAVTNAAKSTAVSQAAGAVAQNQAEKYIENLPIPEHLDVGPAPTSADVIATFPETNPANIQGPPEQIDTTLLDLTTAPSTPTTHTYTYDDGSTLTVDASGTPVGYTDATETPYKGPVETPSSPLTKSQIEGMIKLGLTVAGASAASKAVQNAISSGGEEPQGGFPFTPSDISGWASPTYTQTFQGPIDLNSLFTTDNLLGGTQWAGLQGNQFANTPQVSMSDFISSIQNGKV